MSSSSEQSLPVQTDPASPLLTSPEEPHLSDPFPSTIPPAPAESSYTLAATNFNSRPPQSLSWSHNPVASLYQVPYSTPRTQLVFGLRHDTNSPISNIEDDTEAYIFDSDEELHEYSLYSPLHEGNTALNIIHVMPNVARYFPGIGPSFLFHKTGDRFRQLQDKTRARLEYHTRRYVSEATLAHLSNMRDASYRLGVILNDLQHETDSFCRCITVKSEPSEKEALINKGQRTEFVTTLFGKPSQNSVISQLLGLDECPEKPQPASFGLLRYLPVEMQCSIVEHAASPPTCPILHLLYRTMERFPERVAEIKKKILSKGDMGPVSDLANLLLLDNCGPAAVFFRGDDFGLWTASHDSRQGPGTRECMQRLYRRSIPKMGDLLTCKATFDNPCFVRYTSNNYPGFDSGIQPTGFADKLMRLMLDFVEAAIHFQQESVKLGRCVLKDYATAEKRIAAEKVCSLSCVDRSELKETYHTDIGTLLRGLFEVDMPMLCRVSENNHRSEVLKALEREQVSDWPGPAIKRRKTLMRLAGNLECGLNYDV